MMSRRAISFGCALTAAIATTACASGTSVPPTTDVQTPAPAGAAAQEPSPPVRPGSVTVRTDVPYARLVAAAEEPHNWFHYSGTYAAERFSALDQITTDNVGDLRAEWVYQTSPGLVETTPIVVDGIMYLTEPPSTVTALAGSVMYMMPSTTIGVVSTRPLPD